MNWTWTWSLSPLLLREVGETPRRETNSTLGEKLQVEKTPLTRLTEVDEQVDGFGKQVDKQVDGVDKQVHEVDKQIDEVDEQVDQVDEVDKADS